MDYNQFCNNSKCSKRMSCKKYLNWLHNELKLDMKKFTSRNEKKCESYEAIEK